MEIIFFLSTVEGIPEHFAEAASVEDFDIAALRRTDGHAGEAGADRLAGGQGAELDAWR
jgi:hypothetical protein